MKLEAMLGFGVATLFAVLLWTIRRNKAKAAGQRGEGATTTLFNQMIWATLFCAMGAVSFSLGELHWTAGLVTMGLTSLIWGLIAMLFAPRRQHATTKR